MRVTVALALGVVSIAGLLLDPPQAWLRCLAELTLTFSILLVMFTILVRPLRRREVALNLGLVGITIGLGLIAGELATRFAFRDVTTTGGPSYFTSRWRDANPKNSLGFREREIGPERAADGLRIAVVGDSFTEGPGLAETERLSSQLEQALERSSDGVEVLNFGRAGAETVDELEVLREVVSPLRPDFVLLQWFVNDVEGHHKEGRPEPWPLLPLPSTHATLKHHSALYFVMNLTWENIQVHLGLTGSYDDYLVRRFADPDGQASKEAFESLEQFFATAERAGIPMGMVLFPLLDESSIDKLGFLLDRVLESCAEHHVICIDLRPALAEVGNLRRLHLNRFDEHPNGVAHAIAARAVLEAFEPLWINGLAARPDPGTVPEEPSGPRREVGGIRFLGHTLAPSCGPRSRFWPTSQCHKPRPPGTEAIDSQGGERGV